MLRAQGLTLAQTIALPDHHDFENWQPPLAGNHALICTEKDAVKLWRHHPRALAVPLVFSPEPAFLAALDITLEQCDAAASGAKLSSTDGHQTT
jgi:tetraacyldisaccharide 4'-kinase